MARSSNSERARVALVHDYLNQYGGAERVLEAMHQLYPDAPVYTSLYEPEALPSHFRSWDIRTSFLQRLPPVRRSPRTFFFLYPLAFESFDLSGYDLVISNSSAWCKGVLTPPDSLHLCYCLTPMRWAWSYDTYVQQEQISGAARYILPAAVHYLRLWDATSAQRVDRFVGISQAVVSRIRKYYRREADCIAPPVDVQSIPASTAPGRGLLVVSRLVPYKRIDLAVAACSQLNLDLTIVGDGRDRARLEGLAGPTVRFTGRVSDQQVREALAACAAFIFPGEEDFGIAPVEAMAAGRPVVAYAGGGALDTVADGLTGCFFAPQTVDALARRLAAFDPTAYDPVAIREHALQFDTRAFQHAFGEYVARAYAEHRAPRGVATGRAPSL
jgi:glycosyltransferase involved in cell wall biosynthesis